MAVPKNMRILLCPGILPHDRISWIASSSFGLYPEPVSFFLFKTNAMVLAIWKGYWRWYEISPVQWAYLDRPS